jgi:hypothetical protein
MPISDLILQNHPSVLNPLTDVKFRLYIPGFTYSQYFCQSVTLPGMTIPVAKQSTPNLTIPVPGTGIEYNKLRVQFLVDEKFNNYFEMYNWIFQIAEPLGGIASNYPEKKSNIFKDVTIQMLTNKDNPNFNLVYYGAFPISLSDIDMDVRTDDIKYITSTVTFTYAYFRNENL